MWTHQHALRDFLGRQPSGDVPDRLQFSWAEMKPLARARETVTLVDDGGYGMLRACFPIVPDAFHEFAFVLGVLGVISIVYGSYVALGQLYRKAGKLGRAGRMAREALRWEPGHAEASELLLAAGDAPDEQDDLQKAVFG